MVYDFATGKVEDDKIDDRIWNWISNTLKDASIADDVTGYAPSFLTTLMENKLNKDFYYNTDIVDSWDLNLPNSEQYYDYNSQLAIWLGKIFNYSPAKIDNTISGWFGGAGTDVVNAIDKFLGLMGITNQKPDMGVEDEISDFNRKRNAALQILTDWQRGSHFG